MNKRLRIVCIVAAVVVVGVAAVLFFLSSILGQVVKKGIETVGPALTKSSVTLESARLSPWSGSGSLTGFVVGNPEGFQTDSAFEFGEVALEIDPGSITSDVIVIKKILIQNAMLTWEGSLKGSNLGKIQKNVEEYVGPSEGAPAGEESGAETKVVIEDFLLAGTKVRVGIGAAAKTVDLPEIHLTDIGRKDTGTTVKEAIDQLLKPILRTTAETVAKNQAELGIGKEGVADTVKEGVKGATDKIKGLLGR